MSVLRVVHIWHQYILMMKWSLLVNFMAQMKFIIHGLEDTEMENLSIGRTVLLWIMKIGILENQITPGEKKIVLSGILLQLKASITNGMIFHAIYKIVLVDTSVRGINKDPHKWSSYLLKQSLICDWLMQLEKTIEKSFFMNDSWLFS